MDVSGVNFTKFYDVLGSVSNFMSYLQFWSGGAAASATIVLQQH